MDEALEEPHVKDGEPRESTLRDAVLQEGGALQAACEPAGNRRIGIVLANTGTPDDPSPEAVGRYLAKFLSNPRIVPMNKTLWAVLLKLFVLPLRKRASSRKYRLIWDDGFAFMRDHEALAQALQERYDERGIDVSVGLSMSFGTPALEATMRSLAEAGCTELAILPLYPQNAYSQASIVADEAARLAPRLQWEGRVRIVGDYSDNERYLDALADCVRDTDFDASRDALLMSFHSVPRRDIDAGDTYESHVHATCEKLAARLSIPQSRWRVSFQSRFDKGREWVGPFTREVLAELAGNFELERLFVICPNFALDCLETYYDVCMVMRDEWKQACEQAGRRQPAPFSYIPCLGASSRQVDVLESVLDF